MRVASLPTKHKLRVIIIEMQSAELSEWASTQSTRNFIISAKRLLTDIDEYKMVFIQKLLNLWVRIVEYYIRYQN